MVTDLGGFAASTFKRGIHFINIPTTLLSLVDASVGGKTGINFGGLKNEVGVFNTSDVVILDTRFLATLPDTESAREVYESVKRGDLTGMSFAFKIPEGGDSYDPKTNTRTITQIEKVYECSVVQFPAYGQTSVEARSMMTESQKKLGQIMSMKKLIAEITKGA